MNKEDKEERPVYKGNERRPWDKQPKRQLKECLNVRGVYFGAVS